MKSEYLKIEQAARLIDVSKWTVRKWIQERKLRTYRFGGAVRIRKSDLIGFARIRPTKDEIMTIF